MNKRKSTLLIVALLLLAVTLGTLAIRTYAKYVSTLPSISSDTYVAKWNFATANSSTTFTIDLSKTYDADTLVANKIAPGTTGSFTIMVSNEGSDVGAKYLIELNRTGAPTNLQFYLDSAYTNNLGDSALSGTLAPNETNKTVTIYWKWPYESGTGDTLTSNDVIDTSNGISGNTMTITATITGTQVEPK